MNTILREDQKVYLPGVRKLSWDTGEMCEFASALGAAVECLGERVPYHYLMGVTGAAFRFTLNPGQWDFGNYSIRSISEDPNEPARRAITALGYEYTILEKGDPQADTARIMDSIERGVPVLAYGVVGPTDCCILTGYDEGGQVLLGWSTYQDIPDDHNIPHDATGYFRKPGWHASLAGYYILLGEKTAPPPARAVYLDALRWALRLVCTPDIAGKRTGLAGLRAWAAEMTDEQYFPAGDPELLGWRYVGAAINMTMLRDHVTAGPFLRQAADVLPEFRPALLQAADLYGEVCRLRDSMDEHIDDAFSEKGMRAIGDPAARRAYAEKILEIAALEEQAARCLAQAGMA